MNSSDRDNDDDDDDGNGNGCRSARDKMMIMRFLFLFLTIMVPLFMSMMVIKATHVTMLLNICIITAVIVRVLGSYTRGFTNCAVYHLAI